MSRIILGGNYGSTLPTPSAGQYAIGFENGDFGVKGDDGVFNIVASASAFPDATTSVYGIARFATSAEAEDGDVVAGPVVVRASDQVIKRKNNTLYSAHILSGPGYSSRSVALGVVELDADYAVVIGHLAVNTEEFSIVIGHAAEIAAGGSPTDKGSVIIGHNATGRDGAIAIGTNANARVGGIAIGSGVDCDVDGAIRVGWDDTNSFYCSPTGQFVVTNLKINQAVTAETNPATHRVLINVNGTDYWLLLRQV